MALICLSFVTTACSDDGNNAENQPILKGKITSYNEFGTAMLDFTEEDMTKAGFTLGDLISITIDDESQLSTIDYAKAFSAYLLSHGMTQSQIDALILALTDKEAI